MKSSWFGTVALLFVCSLLSGQATDARIGSGKSAERYPVLHPAGTELFFSRMHHKSNRGKEDAPDVWVRRRDESGRWLRAINPGAPINTDAADRALTMSPDGNLLAVLREGQLRYIDVLRRDGRHWKKVARTQVPSQVEKGSELTYNIVTGDLVYAAGPGLEQSDLYLMRLDEEGNWATASRLTKLNTAADESRPFFTPDGRTLYFFRSGQGWFKQTDRGAPAVATRIPILVRRFAVSIEREAREMQAIVELSGSGSPAELRGMLISSQDHPPVARLVTIAPGAEEVPLTSGVTLPLQLPKPGPARLYLRQGEELADGSELSALDVDRTTVGGSRGEGEAPVLVNDEATALAYKILRQERLLDELFQKRRRYLDSAAHQDYTYRTQAYSNQVDTFPPGNDVRARYADDLRELEAMKARFRRQQDEQRTGRSSIRTRSQSLPTRAKQIGSSPAPPRSYSPVSKDNTPHHKPSPKQASSAEPRVGPYGNYQQPGTYPPSTSAEPRADRSINDIDQEYQQAYEELERLKAQLARSRGQSYTPTSQFEKPLRQNTQISSPAIPRSTPPRPANEANRIWNSRGPEPAPPSQRQHLTPEPPRSTLSNSNSYRPGESAMSPAAISFISNTAYVDGKGYGGLDELVNYINAAPGPVEVRIHTSIDLNPRAAQLLSEERALTIRTYLIEQGIAERHFKVTGYGNNLTGKGGERVEVY